MSQLEKENLEAHVDLCAARYEVLQEKLGSMMSRIERMEENINTLMKIINQNSINIERHAATNTNNRQCRHSDCRIVKHNRCYFNEHILS